MDDLVEDAPTVDVEIVLGDQAAHAHEWRTTGVDGGGVHQLVCRSCPEVAVGVGDFEAAP